MISAQVSCPYLTTLYYTSGPSDGKRNRTTRLSSLRPTICHVVMLFVFLSLVPILTIISHFLLPLSLLTLCKIRIHPSSNTNTTTFNLGANSNIDTVGTYMVPTQDVDTCISELTDRGLVINSMHNFKDLRGDKRGLEIYRH